ncbi:TPA: hypothetical protein N0F65_009692 [Lagenidium giganteum]|uniref:Protein kinase domain-containing protein n=1 Tax=Lagenidium giganteum TaxID=4803 RepID=A0AAV2YVG6_9STRA|nr:TPA: hypothetical protein N0F65_009692 [Lagenidium giganteum]
MERFDPHESAAMDVLTREAASSTPMSSTSSSGSTSWPVADHPEASSHTETKTTKAVLEELRVQHARLEKQRDDLAARDAHAVATYSLWQRLAHEQRKRKHEALQENRKLRQAVAEQRLLVTNMRKVFQTPAPHAAWAQSIEDNEWQGSLMSPQPSRRRHNAERIMAHLLNDLRSHMIAADMLEVRGNQRFTKYINLEDPSRGLTLYVNSQCELAADYVEVARSIWERAIVGNFEGKAGVTVGNQVSETFSDDLVYTVSSYHAAGSVPNVCRQLHHVREDGQRVVIAWKKVEEVSDTTGPKAGSASSMHGWIAVDNNFSDNNNDSITGYDRPTRSCTIRMSVRVSYPSVEEGTAESTMERTLATLQIDPDAPRIARQRMLRYIEFTEGVLWKFNDRVHAVAQSVAERATVERGGLDWINEQRDWQRGAMSGSRTARTRRSRPPDATKLTTGNAAPTAIVRRPASAPVAATGFSTTRAKRKKPQAWTKSLAKRIGAPWTKQNVVHPINITQEGPKTAGNSQSEGPSSDSNGEIEALLIVVRVQHALDLHNPCIALNCQHEFKPVVGAIVNGTHEQSRQASQHARNCAMWVKSSSMDFRLEPHAVERATSVSVYFSLWGQCETHDNRIFIGETERIPLSVPKVDDHPHRHIDSLSVFRERVVGRMITRYPMGVIKVRFACEWQRRGRPSSISTPTTASKKKKSVVAVTQVTDQCKDMKVNESLSAASAISAKEQTLNSELPSSNPSEVSTSQIPTVVKEIPKQAPSQPPEDSRLSPAHSTGALAPVRPSMRLPINLGEALQTKRSQLKITEKPPSSPGKPPPPQFDEKESLALMAQLEEETTTLRLNPNQLVIHDIIGEGAHACVKAAQMRWQADGRMMIRDVAVKEFRFAHKFVPAPVLANFQQELRAFGRLGVHQNIVKLLGVLLHPEPALIMEYLPDGSLAQCLNNTETWERVSLHQKLSMALQIARGISFIHSREMVHRDIKCHNIAVAHIKTQHPIVKVCDFGTCFVKATPRTLAFEEVGSSGYTAPEVFLPDGYQEKVDVWSFGVVLWELTCASPEWRRQSNPLRGLSGDAMVAMAREGVRPALDPRDRHQTQYFRGLLEQCWQWEPVPRN